MIPSVSIPRVRRPQRRPGEKKTRFLQVLVGAFLLLSPAFASAAPTFFIPKATGVFDYNPWTSLKANPTITGSATSSAPLRFRVTGTSGVVFEDPAVWLTAGRFSETVYPAIPNGSYVLSLLSGSSTIATSTLRIGLRSLPTIQQDTSLSQSDVIDGHLMRFVVYTRGRSGMGIQQFSFVMSPTNASVADIYLYAYTDPNFTKPIYASSTDPLALQPVQINATTSMVTIVPDQTIEMPANSAYYFDLVGTVIPLDITYNVETTLLNDTNPRFALYSDLASTSNFIWSPNTYGISSLDMHDWTNGALVSGIPNRGLITVRTNAPPTNLPICSLVAATTTASAGTPVTFNWSSINAISAVWDSGARDAVNGSKVYTQGSTTRTYTLTFSNPYGSTSCYATVGMPYTAVAPAATTSTAVVDGFTATPTTGLISLLVTATGSVNNAKSCAAQTYSFNFGEGATSTISVAKSLCKAQAFTLTHTYTKAGTFTAALYSGTGTSSTQRIQTQVITPTAKAALNTGAANAASVLSAIQGGVRGIISALLHFLGL